MNKFFFLFILCTTTLTYTMEKEKKKTKHPTVVVMSSPKDTCFDLNSCLANNRKCISITCGSVCCGLGCAAANSPHLYPTSSFFMFNAGMLCLPVIEEYKRKNRSTLDLARDVKNDIVGLFSALYKKQEKNKVKEE